MSEKIRPQVRGNRGNNHKASAFVVMPIRKKGSDEHRDFLALYSKFIKPVLEEHGYEVVRADEIAASGSITKDIIIRLVEADLVICDLTDLNPNVFYELGVRHTLRNRGTILILDEAKTFDIPFDLSDYRIIKFQGVNADGLGSLKDELQRFVSEFRDNTALSADNPVHDWIPPTPSSQRTKKDGNRMLSGERLEGDGVGPLNPEEVISDALREAESGVLPKVLIDEAHRAVKEEDMLKFLESVQRFLSVRAFQPSEREFAELYSLAERLDARRVSRAVLDIGLKVYPGSKYLTELRIGSLAHSTDPSEREEARRMVAGLLNLAIGNTDIIVTNPDAVRNNIGLLALMLDAFHRDGKHDEALRITATLVEQFPNSSTALRNHARALEMKGGMTVDDLIESYRRAVLSDTVDDSSAAWFAGTLEGAGRLVDAAEALLLACMLDLDEAKNLALLAATLANILQPRNALMLQKARRALPEDCDEAVILRCILMSMSCPNFGTEQKFICETAMRNIGIGDSDVEEALYEYGEITRRDRREFVSGLYGKIQSPLTAQNEVLRAALQAS